MRTSMWWSPQDLSRSIFNSREPTDFSDILDSDLNAASEETVWALQSALEEKPRICSCWETLQWIWEWAYCVNWCWFYDAPQIDLWWNSRHLKNHAETSDSSFQKDIMSSYHYYPDDLVIKWKTFTFIAYPDWDLDNPISLLWSFKLRTQKFFNGVRTVYVPEADIFINKWPTDDNLQKLMRRLVLSRQN